MSIHKWSGLKTQCLKPGVVRRTVVSRGVRHCVAQHFENVAQHSAAFSGIPIHSSEPIGFLFYQFRAIYAPCEPHFAS